jgi:hypothetical protein
MRAQVPQSKPPGCGPPLAGTTTGSSFARITLHCIYCMRHDLEKKELLGFVDSIDLRKFSVPAF